MPHTFLSDMSQREHGTLNKLLNGIVENPPDPHDRIAYKRTKQKDSFYRNNGQRVRVSTLVDTGEVTDIVQKAKIDHLNIYCPNSPLDLRISVSTETKCKPYSSYGVSARECSDKNIGEMPEGEAEDVRVKDRISYSNSICQTDLTYATFTVSCQTHQHACGEPRSDISRVQTANPSLHTRSRSK